MIFTEHRTNTFFGFIVQTNLHGKPGAGVGVRTATTVWHRSETEPLLTIETYGNRIHKQHSRMVEFVENAEILPAESKDGFGCERRRLWRIAVGRD